MEKGGFKNRVIESGIGSVSIKPDFNRNFNAYKVQNVVHGQYHRKKKSVSKAGNNMAGVGKKIVSGG